MKLTNFTDPKKLPNWLKFLPRKVIFVQNIMLKYSDVSHQNDTIFAMSYEQMQLLFVQNTTSKFLFTIKVLLCYIPYETYSLVFHLKASLSVQNIILKHHIKTSSSLTQNL